MEAIDRQAIARATDVNVPGIVTNQPVGRTERRPNTQTHPQPRNSTNQQVGRTERRPDPSRIPTNQVLDLAPEDDLDATGWLEVLFGSETAQEHHVDHYVNNHEAGPSNRLQAEITPQDVNLLSTDTGFAQACVDDLQFWTQGLAATATLMAAIQKSDGKNSKLS